MFGWLINLFKTEDKVEGPGISKPKVTPTIEEVKVKEIQTKKPGRKKKGVTKTDLNKMNKDELEKFAKTYGVDIDKRRKKADLVKQVLELTQ